MLNYIRSYSLFLINQLDLFVDIIGIIKNDYINNPHLLEHVNHHPRDDCIKFYEVGHKYDLTVNNQVLNPISVTTLIHHYCQEFNADLIIKRMIMSKNWHASKYYGMFPQEIKDKWENDKNSAASAGTEMHLNIEYCLNQLNFNYSIELQYFANFWKDFKLKYKNFSIYRTEMTVFDEDFRDGKAICGSIDALLKNDQDEYIILDWKRSKEIKYKGYTKMKYPFQHLDDCNYNHYCLQLNIYKHILKINYGFNIKGMALVILHPNQDNYSCIPVNDINLDELWMTL